MSFFFIYCRLDESIRFKIFLESAGFSVKSGHQWVGKDVSMHGDDEAGLFFMYWLKDSGRIEEN